MYSNAVDIVQKKVSEVKIIELIGLPGSGKTTLINTMLNDYTVSTNVTTRNNMFQRKLPYLWLKQYKLYFCLFFRLQYIMRKSAMKQKRVYIKRLIRLVIYLTYYEEKDRDSILLLDEGIVQYITSLEYEHDLTADVLSFAELLLSHYCPIIVDCQIPVAIVEERVRIRNKKGDRYNLQTQNCLRNLLIQKRKNLDLITNVYYAPGYSLDMTDSVEHLTKSLYEIVEENCEKG